MQAIFRKVKKKHVRKEKPSMAAIIQSVEKAIFLKSATMKCIYNTVK